MTKHWPYLFHSFYFLRNKTRYHFDLLKSSYLVWQCKKIIQSAALQSTKKPNFPFILQNFSILHGNGSALSASVSSPSAGSQGSWSLFSNGEGQSRPGHRIASPSCRFFPVNDRFKSRFCFRVKYSYSKRYFFLISAI